MRPALRRALLLLLAISGVTGAACYLAWQDMQSTLDQPISLSAPVLFVIEPGTSITKVSRRFQDNGWLKHALYLRIEATQRKLAARIQAGTYEVRPGDSPRQLLSKFASGDVKSYAVTLVEGATFAEIRRQVSKLPGVTPTLQSTTSEAVMAAIGGPDTFPEGWLFPSTYYYHHATTDKDLLARAYRKMVDVLEKHWANRAPDLPYATPYDALIMASIVEKETGRASERATIAGVFVRRLQQQMKLQTDPTVIYGLGSAFDGNLRRRDLELDTPYNTYLRPGLPPTPICSPGEDSIVAALNPAPGDALYFVGRGDGSHEFSATLEAHNRAVRQFQLKEKMP